MRDHPALPGWQQQLDVYRSIAGVVQTHQSWSRLLRSLFTITNGTSEWAFDVGLRSAPFEGGRNPEYRRLCRGMVIGVLTLLPVFALAGEFPTKPVKMVTSVAAGNNEFTTRLISTGLTESLQTAALCGALQLYYRVISIYCLTLSCETSL